MLESCLSYRHLGFKIYVYLYVFVLWRVWAISLFFKFFYFSHMHCKDAGCGSAATRTVPQGQSDVTLKCFLNLYLPRNGKLFVFILPQPTCGTEVAHMKGLESLL